MALTAWKHFFKPEVRSRAGTLVAKVSAAHPSDTEVIAYARASTSFKITLKSPSVESSVIEADCNCPLSRKGQFCKHIWATLLVTEDQFPDFLDGKTEIQKAATATSMAATPKARALSEAQQASQAALKEKQALYRKIQYQKQKKRAQELKLAKKLTTEAPKWPDNVEIALEYFHQNGFDLRESMTKPSVALAMKKLARIFHPDLGGTHAEFLELNQHTDTLLKFAK